MFFDSSLAHNKSSIKYQKFHKKIRKIKKYRTEGIKQKVNNIRQKVHHCDYLIDQPKHVIYSPEYQATEPMVIKPMAFSHQYKPEIGQQQQTNVQYGCYIDSLVMMRMQMEQARDRELIEKLSRIRFEQGC